MAARIERTLTLERQNGGQTVIRQDGILSFRDPVVILGDPGLGKTVLAQLARRATQREIHPRRHIRACKKPCRILVAGTERIVVDGLDEIASAAQGRCGRRGAEAIIGEPAIRRSSFPAAPPTGWAPPTG